MFLVTNALNSVAMQKLFLLGENFVCAESTERKGEKPQIFPSHADRNSQGTSNFSAEMYVCSGDDAIPQMRIRKGWR